MARVMAWFEVLRLFPVCTIHSGLNLSLPSTPFLGSWPCFTDRPVDGEESDIWCCSSYTIGCTSRRQSGRSGVTPRAAVRSRMRCPKCQFDHELQTTDCLKCGIVFSRYQAAQEAAAKKFKFPAPAVRAAEPRYWYTARPRRWPHYQYPLTWEGWLAPFIFIVSCGALHLFVDERKHPLRFLGLTFGLLALFVAIVHWKSEPKRKFWDD
jgi:hypothetical protein